MGVLHRQSVPPLCKPQPDMHIHRLRRGLGTQAQTLEIITKERTGETDGDICGDRCEGLESNAAIHATVYAKEAWAALETRDHCLGGI